MAIKKKSSPTTKTNLIDAKSIRKEKEKKKVKLLNK